MGMYDILRDVVKVFRSDESLLRLLYYPAQNLITNTKDPLDASLPNILSMNEEKLWQIRDKTIYTISKGDDLETEPLCRIYLYAGRRNPDRNYLLANQEITVEIFIHNEYEKDLRSLRVSDRVNELLISQHITGIGKVEYVQGFPINAPNDYVAYRHNYEIRNLLA